MMSDFMKKYQKIGFDCRFFKEIEDYIKLRKKNEYGWIAIIHFE